MSVIKLLTELGGNVTDVELSLSQSKNLFDPVTVIDTEIGGFSEVNLGAGSSSDVFGVLAGIEVDDTPHVRHFVANNPTASQIAGRLNLSSSVLANDATVNFNNIDDSLVPSTTINYPETAINHSQLYVGVRSFSIPIHDGYARFLIDGVVTVNFDVLAKLPNGSTATKSASGYGDVVGTKNGANIDCIITLTENVVITYTEVYGDILQAYGGGGTDKYGSVALPLPHAMTAGQSIIFKQPQTPGFKFLVTITIDRGFGSEPQTFEVTIINNVGYCNSSIHNGYLFPVREGWVYQLRAAVSFTLVDVSYRTVMTVPTGQTLSYPTITTIVSPELNVSIPEAGYTATPITKLVQGGFIGFFKTLETITINSMPVNAVTYAHASATANYARSADGKSTVLGYDGNAITFETPPPPANFPIQVEIVRVETKRALSIAGNTVTLSSPLKYAYATTDHVTSFIQLYALRELVTAIANRTAVNNPSPPAAAYNSMQHEITTTTGTIEGVYSIVFTTQTAYELRHNLLGVIGTGNINSDNPIINQDTGTPYLNIPIAGFGGGWVAGNVITITVEGGKKRLKAYRRVDKTVDTIYNTEFSIALIGSVKV